MVIPCQAVDEEPIRTGRTGAYPIPYQAAAEPNADDGIRSSGVGSTSASQVSSSELEVELVPGTAVALEGVAFISAVRGVAWVHGWPLLPEHGEVLVASKGSIAASLVVEAPEDPSKYLQPHLQEAMKGPRPPRRAEVFVDLVQTVEISRYFTYVSRMLA
jgi:hypothetical protein